MCLIVGCTSYGWTIFYLISGPAMFIYLFYVAVVDSEPCLAIGLTLQTVFICLATTALARRLYVRWHKRRAARGPDGAAQCTSSVQKV